MPEMTDMIRDGALSAALPAQTGSQPAVARGGMLRAVVFSKDRPLQLHATLASLFARCTDRHLLDVRVLALASDEVMKRRYEQVGRELQFATIVAESNFQQNVLEIVHDAGHVAFVCDDALFVRPWSVGRAVRLLCDIPNAIGVSLRLGRNTSNCYPVRRFQRIPVSSDLGGGWCACDWTKAELDFAYPLELSSSIYRVQDLWPLLTGMSYRTPNQLEEQLAVRAAGFSTRLPILVFSQSSIAFCAPLNVVQSTHANRHGGQANQSAQALTERFDEGQRVDVDALQGYTPAACHEEIELPLYKVPETALIPKVIHFIWVGDDTKRPDQFLASWVHHHPGWTIKIWGNDDLASPQWKNRQVLSQFGRSDPARAAALLRWEILLAEGGLVFDIDSACIRPLDDSLLESEAFACWENELAEPGLVSASFVGSVPNNPFFETIVSQIGADPDLVHTPLREAAGSGRLTRTWRSERYDGLTVFPSHYFNPRHPSGINYEGRGQVYAIHAWSSAGEAANGATSLSRDSLVAAVPDAQDGSATATCLPEAQRPAVKVPAAARFEKPGGQTTAGVVNVNFFCHIDKTGMGRHAESVLLSLLKAHPPGLRVNYLDSTKTLSVRQLLINGRAGADITLFFWRMPAQFIEQVPGQRVLWVVFESDRLPQRWIEQIRAHDRIWTPSDWGRDVLLAHGLEEERVRVVEEGVDGTIFNPAPTPHPGFVFLSVGKYEARKSIDETIEAFRFEFPLSRDPSVRLWLKADYPGMPARAAQLREKTASDPRIRVISDSLSDQQLASLYNSCDAFVYPSKAEGFGLPCIEAIACGLPVIATDYSGQSVILKHIKGLFIPVDYELVPIEDPDFNNFYRSDYDGQDIGRWAMPSVKSLRQAMRTVYQDKRVWRERAVQASDIIRSRLSWDRIGAKVLGELTETALG